MHRYIVLTPSLRRQKGVTALYYEPSRLDNSTFLPTQPTMDLRRFVDMCQGPLLLLLWSRVSSSHAPLHFFCVITLPLPAQPAADQVFLLSRCSAALTTRGWPRPWKTYDLHDCFLMRRELLSKADACRSAAVQERFNRTHATVIL